MLFKKKNHTVFFFLILIMFASLCYAGTLTYAKCEFSCAAARATCYALAGFFGLFSVIGCDFAYATCMNECVTSTR